MDGAGRAAKLHAAQAAAGSERAEIVEPDTITKLPGAMLDGLLAIDDLLIISSWKAETIYRGPRGGTFTPIVTHIKGVADLGYASKRKRLLVPRFLDDTVEVYELK